MSPKTHDPTTASALTSFLYRTLGKQILKFVLKRNGGDMEAAEQVVQDTFVAAFRSFHTFQSKSTYFTWLCRIALNKLADYYRDQVNSRSRLVVPAARQLEELLSPELAPEEKMAIDELRANMSRCMNLLPAEYRRLLHLKYYQQLSSKEICVQLNVSPRQLEGKLYRARHSLAKVVGAHYPHLKPENSHD